MSSLEKDPANHAFTSSATTESFVDWDGPNDPENPLNWTTLKKLALTGTVCLAVFILSFASSVFAPANEVTAQEYAVSRTVMSLSIALFIGGFTLGPLFFGPLSEMLGHLIPLWTGIAAIALFQIPLGIATNVATILISRFIAGAIGSSILAVGSGMFVNVYDPITRGIAASLSATMLNFGSVVAPIAAVYLVNGPGWRWTAWVTLILCGSVGVLGLFCLRETSPRIVLRNKARRLRKETGDNNLRAKSELECPSISLLVKKYLSQPIRMFVQEPILIILTIYLTLTYGTLYLSYQMFPFAFKKRGWSTTSAYLPFTSVALGAMAAWGFFSIFLLTYFKLRLASGTVTPEDRLPPMILAGAILPPALLWFGWSQLTHWVSQVFACFFIGFSLVLIFVTGVVYMLDVYVENANSAISIHVVVRSIAAASFPLWSAPLYESLGVEWSATLLAGLSLLMLPFPVVFFVFGKKIRGWSRYAVDAE
ncbi:major facilitator superfamily domain-containing protein [Lophiotrema nucula]|uniref:Major facilitator superfamily domain-containing protein n=1 Tax=Lophiotrema nucula TaxID=690887 RepID=A0A6A5ZFJ8_9PLEO|nr:major facilitator superfamily domain-containing protein [Lophiotrema nucula]